VAAATLSTGLDGGAVGFSVDAGESVEVGTTGSSSAKVLNGAITDEAMATTWTRTRTRRVVL
jgi:mevalonate pyrophosphate decarboxylase